MTASTTKYAIPYPTGTDPVADGDDTMQDLAERADLMLGESGTDSITPSAANTTTSKRINYGRSYAPAVPIPIVCVGATTTPPGTLSLWVSGADSTGFTALVQRTNTTAVPFNWTCRL